MMRTPFSLPHPRYETRQRAVALLKRATCAIRAAALAGLCFGMFSGVSPAQAQGLSTSAEQVDCEFVRVTLNYVDPTATAYDAAAAADMSFSLFSSLPENFSWVRTSITIATNFTALPAAGGLSPRFYDSDKQFGINDMKLPVPPDAEGLYLTVTALATFDRTRFADGDHIRIDSELDAFNRGSTIHEAHMFSDVVLDLKDCDGAAPPALPEAPPLPPGVPAPGPDADVGSCLVVEGGDVECDPLNPGIYIYKMSVDASHAGQMIELAPTTPGIGVFPPSQVVPAGGGVLEWSIDGAAPGMTVEFIVNGFHTDIIGHVSGPREGLGLCCATEFKIVIPVGDCPPPPCPGPGCPPPPPPEGCDGTDCPPPPPPPSCEEGEECPPPPPPPGELEPNIQVVKDATVTSCTLDGNCTFHIVVTNTGPGIYSGPLAIDDWTTPDLIPTTGITFEPSPPWTYGIAADGTPFFSHPSVTLGVGDSRDLTVTFVPGPDWPADAINNCARFNYAQSEHAPFGDPNDDRDCEIIPICFQGQCPGEEPPQGGEPQLAIAKDLLSDDGTTCSLQADGLVSCVFKITITNTGTAAHTGPIVLTDAFPTGPVESFDWEPKATWTCAEDGGADRYRCEYSGPPLPPAAEMLLVIQAVVASDNPAREVQNCAALDQTPSAGDCATGDLPQAEEPPSEHAADLNLEKACEPVDDLGRFTCTLTVTNNGTAAPSGTIVLNDEIKDADSGAPIQATGVTPGEPIWTCSDLPADRFSCTTPATNFGPDQSHSVDVTFTLGPGQTAFENCVEGINSTTDVHVFGNVCVNSAGTPPEPGGEPTSGAPDLELDKSCEPLDDLGRFKCTLTVTNNGTAAPSGTITLVDGTTNEPGGTPILANQVTPDAADLWTCADEPANQVSCTINGAQLGPDQSHHVDIEFQISPGQTGYKNCVEGLNTTDDVHSFANKCVSSEPEAKPKEDEKGEKGEEGEKPACTNGMVLNEKGLCACPEGSEWNGRRCVGAGGTTAPLAPEPTPPPPPERKRCPKNWIGDYEPDCKKPTCEQKGMIGDWPECRSRPERKRCPKDWIGDYEPDCKKPTCEQKGMIGDWPECRSRPEPVPCPKGWKGKYQPNCTKPTCQEQGMVGDWPDCHKLVPCPKGWKGKYQPNCTKPTCQEQGMVGNWPHCQRLVPCPKGWKGKYQPNCTKPTCQEQGMVGNWPHCQRLVPCPKGWKGKYQPNCVKPTCQEQGMVGDWPHCHKLVPCPKGWKGKYQPNCVKPTCQEKGMVGNWPHCQKLVPCPKGWKGKYQPNCTPPPKPAKRWQYWLPEGSVFLADRKEVRAVLLAYRSRRNP